MEGIWVVLIVLIVFGTFFGSIAAIFVVPSYLKSQERARLQDTLRVAIDKGQPLPPEVIDALTKDVHVETVPSSDRDTRRGVIWLAVALGLVAIGLVNGFSDGLMEGFFVDADGWFGLAALPGFIGLAFIVLGAINRKKQQKAA